MGLFKAIGRFLKKLLSLIKKILAVLLIVIAVILFVWATICTAGATLVIFGFAISATMAVILGVLAVVGAFLIDGKTASKVVGKIGDAAGKAAESVAGAVGKVTEGAVTGFLGSSGGLLLVGGVLAYFLLSGSSSDKPEVSKDAKPVRNRPPDNSRRSNDSAPMIGNLAEADTMGLLEA